MTERKQKKQRAWYWRYDGKHPEGRNQPRYNKYGYPLSLVAFVASLGREDVIVRSGKGDGFGHTVSVDAPQEIWEEAWVSLARKMGSDVYFDDIEEDEYGCLWGRVKALYADDDDELHELFYQHDCTELEHVQDGYIPVAILDGKTLWMQCEEIRKSE